MCSSDKPCIAHSVDMPIRNEWADIFEFGTPSTCKARFNTAENW